MKILITAFEPFGGNPFNSTQKLIEILPEKISDKEITKIVLPVVFGKCAEILREKISNKKYDYIICLGQNNRTDMLNVERVAININDAKIADNAGNMPQDEPIVDGGKEAYFTTLPINEMVLAASESGIPAQVSNSAGTFVCNNLMYHVLSMTSETQTKAGFIHVPQTHFQAQNNNYPWMESADAAKGLNAMIAVL